MTVPREGPQDVPHGDGPDEPQNETVHTPHRDEDPPTRSGAPVLVSGAMLALCIVLGVALVVVALLVAF